MPDFKMYIPRKKFISDNDLSGCPNMSESLKSVDAIVSLSDVSRIFGSLDAQPLSASMFDKKELVCLLRGVIDMRGNAVYSNAEIEFEQKTSASIFARQIHVESDKIQQNAISLKRLFDRFGITDITSVESSMLFVESGGQRFAAFYFPPIIEVVDRINFSLPITMLHNRIKCGDDRFEIDTPQGKKEINVKNLYYKAEKIISMNERIQILRDGTHRAYLSHLLKAPFHVIIIRNCNVPSHSIPIAFDDLILAVGKPKRKEDRFLGFCDNLWLDMQRAGIDG
jgi:hypothetical protein